MEGYWLPLGIWNRNLTVALWDIMNEHNDWAILPDGQAEIFRKRYNFSHNVDFAEARRLYGQWIRKTFDCQLSTDSHKWHKDKYGFICSRRKNAYYNPFDYFFLESGKQLKKLYTGIVYYRVRPEWIYGACDYLEGGELSEELKKYVIGVPLNPIQQFLEAEKNRKLLECKDFPTMFEQEKEMLRIEEDFFLEHKMGYIFEEKKKNG